MALQPETMRKTDDVNLERNDAGRLDHRPRPGTPPLSVVPVRAFPLSNPDHGISLIDSHGHEVRWIDDVAALSARTRAMLVDDLERREFRPRITRIVSVSTFATPSIWRVETDRGTTQLLLKAEEDIRRLGAARLLIASSSGVSFEVIDRWALDRSSRRLLERFL